MKNFSSIIWGLVFIAIGAALLLDRLGYMQFDLGQFLHTWWPLILIIIGLGMLFDRPHEGKAK
jgi:lia operon protein LiaF